MHCDRCVYRSSSCRFCLTLTRSFAHSCGGRGKSIKHVCTACRGHRIVEQQSELNLHIDRGMPEGAEIVFEGEADESPDWVAGDVIVRVRSKKERGGFVRKESNLYWKEPISVSEVRLVTLLALLARSLTQYSHTGATRLQAPRPRTGRSRHCALADWRDATRSVRSGFMFSALAF